MIMMLIYDLNALCDDCTEVALEKSRWKDMGEAFDQLWEIKGYKKTNILVS